MHLPRFACYFFSTQVALVFILLPNEASTQGLGLLAELAAVLGVLPVSQLILAGAGIVGLKVALIVRLLSLLGVIPEKKVPLITGPSSAGSSQFAPSPALEEADARKAFVDRESGITSSPPSSLFGLPHSSPDGSVARSPFDFDDDGGDMATSPSPASESIKTDQEKDDEPDSLELGTLTLGPLDGDGTGQTDAQGSHLLSAFPTLLLALQQGGYPLHPLPSQPAAAWDHSSTSPSSAIKGIGETSQSPNSLEKPGNFILYPLVPNKVSAVEGNKVESGFSPTKQEEIKILLSNGSVVPAAGLIDHQVEIAGFKFISARASSSDKSSTSTSQQHSAESDASSKSTTSN